MSLLVCLEKMTLLLGKAHPISRYWIFKVFTGSLSQKFDNKNHEDLVELNKILAGPPRSYVQNLLRLHLPRFLTLPNTANKIWIRLFGHFSQLGNEDYLGIN